MSGHMTILSCLPLHELTAGLGIRVWGLISPPHQLREKMIRAVVFQWQVHMSSVGRFIENNGGDHLDACWMVCFGLNAYLRS